LISNCVITQQINGLIAKLLPGNEFYFGPGRTTNLAVKAPCVLRPKTAANQIVE
jgi:hypothetical protein